MGFQVRLLQSIIQREAVVLPANAMKNALQKIQTYTKVFFW